MSGGNDVSPLPDEAYLIRDETGTQTLIGYVVDISDPPRAHCWLNVGPTHTNRHNVLHGGITGCLLDNASGTAGSLTVDPSGTAPFLTISMTTQFIAPGRPGWVKATGTVIGGGRSLLYINAVLAQDDGTVIATSTGVFKRVPQEKLT
ncbi:PaaI family thioesterase [Sulfitobacter geojensis]|uniref:PaaI family thioesterase n=1 Tax=Sulfitobacter geojensis TaxID=1342299 RepID=A0AAE2W104_9RHOB|nr:PaaI family thioesterase [Sulfitobacter geojensis]MBM1690877.1 PaaI family thioesterase [Sulfitobacter geojensis]MBM1694943.1 PaaI family thioesterase [Sulfitobacter geojensis]MBM1706903.1 PaaI family thioesterase [Sulfitobacter geojensis]MBM1710961.1 PaaI family thioesterase [Sulfitobacter geojensis]MBM1715027.1 PaaI family thioesterase [Sulfitobacter geojensis]